MRYSTTRIFFLIVAILIVIAGLGLGYALYAPPISEVRVISVAHEHAQPLSDNATDYDTAPTGDTPHHSLNTPVQPVTLAFVGDLNLDRYIRTVAEKRGYAFLLGDDVRALFAQQSCVIGNLEGPITTHASVSQGSVIGSANNYRFTFDPTVTTFLTDAHFCAVNIGNNHIDNFGREGIATTRAYLAEGGILAFGDTGDDTPRFVVNVFDGIRVAFVNDNAFVTGGHAHALDDIRTVRAHADIVIVYTHWGAEYITTANTIQRQQARELIDAGADVVIGSHPHVVQDREDYNGKRIYYSLGNFIFDQYFQPETQRGLVVSVTIDPQFATLTFHETAVTLRPTGQTVLAHP